MEWNWVISKQIIDQSTSLAAFKNSFSSANYSTSIWFTSFIQMLCIDEQWWRSQQLGKWLVFPLASVVPLVPQLPFAVCWLQVCCWYRLALQGCCASMAHSWESFCFPVLVLPPPDCPHAGICTCSGKVDWRLKPVYFLVCGTRLQDWAEDLLVVCCVPVCSTE